MLSFFRNSLQGVAVKALMVLLALTFILWGAGDMLTGVSSEPYLFKIGNLEFTKSMWKEALSRQIQHLNQTYGQNFSEEELKNSGFHANLLDKLINKSVLSQEADRLGVLVSDEMVKYDIASHPTFQDGTGKFNKEIFENTLRQMGVPQEKFINTLKEDVAVNNLLSPFIHYNLPPPQFIEQLSLVADLEREIELYEIDGDKIVISSNPSDQELQNILDKNQILFSTPEAREVSYFTFNIKDVDQNVEVTDKELEAQYKSKILLFTQPEKRTVHHLIFKDMDIALEAKKRYENGEKLAAIGKSLNALNKETLIGTLTSDGFDKEIAEAIFSIKEGEISMPVQSPMGIHLFQVTKITPRNTLSFEEAKPTLKRQYIEEKLFERLSTLAQHIDSEIANNKTIEEIAKQYNYKIIRTKVTEQNNSNASKDMEGSPAFKTTTFSTDLNTNSMVTPYNDETFFVIRVEKIEHKRFKPKEEVKGELIKFWMDEQKAISLEKVSRKLEEILKAKQPIPVEIRKYLNIKKLKLSRQNNESLPNDFLDEIYQTPLKQITAAYKINNKYLVAKLIKLNKPSKQALEKDKFEIQMLYAQSQGDIYMKEYLAAAKDRYKILINYDLL